MTLRVDSWKMHIGIKEHNNWFDPKSYPSSDCGEFADGPDGEMTPDSEEFGHIGRAFFARKLWAPTAAEPFFAAHSRVRRSSLQARGQTL